MSNGTAPAWQARDIERNDLLKEVKATIESKGHKFGKSSDLYRLVMFIVDDKLHHRGVFNLISLAKVMPDIPWPARYAVFEVFTMAEVAFSKFQRAPEEYLALWARVFEWANAQIVSSHLSALQAVEMSNPLLIYRVTDRTKEVPVG